jgi:threonine/homoserine/homoserine lactone efflux protein
VESSIVFTYVVAAAASRAIARAATAVVNTMLVLAVWTALVVTGAAMLFGRLPGAARRLVRPLHFQIHW